MALVTNIPLTSANVEPLSRHEMLLWVNECLQAEFAKLEQVLFPGTIQMKKVKFNSRLELDWLSNWKIVQTSWKQLGIEKVIPVEKLIKGKFQDNFEFLQWFKKFFDANYDGHAYNPMEMRNFEELPKEGKLKANSGGTALKMPQRTQLQQQKARPPPSFTSTGTTLPMASRRVGSDASIHSGSGGSGGGGGGAGYAAARKTTPTSATPSGRGTTRLTSSKTPMAATTARQQLQQQQFGGGAIAKTISASAAAASVVPVPRHQPQQQQQSPLDAHINDLIDEMKHKNIEIDELRTQLTESDEVISGLERERDFYFAKLRKIEVLCQDNENAGNLEVASVLQILYETEEGFAPPTDDGTNGEAAVTNGGGDDDDDGTEGVGIPSRMIDR